MKTTGCPSIFTASGVLGSDVVLAVISVAWARFLSMRVQCARASLMLDVLEQVCMLFNNCVIQTSIRE